MVEWPSALYHLNSADLACMSLSVALREIDGGSVHVGGGVASRVTVVDEQYHH